VETQDTKDQPVGELVKQLSEQTATLVRKEIRLAQVEVQEKGKRAGIGAGLFGGAGAIALYGIGALVAAAILGLATALAAWLAALIVGAVLLAVAGISALVGKKQVQQAVPPTPDQAIQSTKRDVEAVKERAAR
jgi:membrane protein